jgi:hypothetical protein
MTNGEAAALALKETVRYGMFLGTFAGTYVSVDECIAALWGRKRSVLSHPAAQILALVPPLKCLLRPTVPSIWFSKDGGQILG